MTTFGYYYWRPGFCNQRVKCGAVFQTGTSHAQEAVNESVEDAVSVKSDYLRMPLIAMVRLHPFKTGKIL